MIKTIEELISINSYSEDENEEVVKYLTDKFEPYAKEIIKVKNRANGKNNLIIGLNTFVKNTDAIILSGHIDTVIPGDSRPYKNGEIINNRLYGLGVIDMKCFFASIIDNIQEISDLKKPIIISITSDEETNLEGINLVLKVLKERSVKPIISIIGEPTSLKICTESKSCFEYNIQIKGKACHSSKPINGINANYIMAKIINKIEKLSKKNKNTTLNVGVANGGEKVNIVAGEASLNFDIRCKFDKDRKSMLSILNKKIVKLEKMYKGCEIKIDNILSIPSLEKNKNLITNKIIKLNNLEESEFTAGCEAGYFKTLGGEAFLFGAGDLSLAHTANEFLDLVKYEEYNKLFLKILSEI